ncbi:MAG: cAMP receptor protein [Smithella sp. PtaU1.Bin162]|nr:MAG: cAMP receptor protein [Smithella sp. PtaU1.Bin162]
MGKLMLWSRKHPWLVILITAVLTIFSLYSARNLKVDVSTEGMMIEGDPAINYYHDTLKKFGTDNITVVYVRDQNLFTPEKLQKLEKLLFALQDIPGVSKAESLFSVTNFKSVDGALETNPLMDMPPATVEEAKRIQKDALRNPTLADNLISKDGTTTAINLHTEVDRNDREFHVRFSRQVDSVITQHKAGFDEIFQFGMSYARRLISENIVADQISLVPLATLALLLTIVIAMRSLSGAFMPLVTAGISVVLTAGFMSLMHIPVNVLTVIIPALIIVIGSTEDIHMLSEYVEGMHESRGLRDEAISYMAGKVGMAVLFTSLTTFLGFLSIVVNDITILKQFGIVASFGLFVNPLITFTVGPVFLHFFGPRKIKQVKQDETRVNVIDRFFVSLEHRIISSITVHKRLILSLLLCAAVIIGFFIVRVQVDNDFLGYFKKSSDIRGRSNILHDNLSGAQTFFIRITSGFPDTFKQPANLSQVTAIQKYIASKGLFDKTQSLADQIALIHREMNNGDAAFYRTPDTAALVSQYLLLIHRDDISRYVNADFSEVNIVVRHNLSSSHELSAALKDLETHLKKTLNPYLRFGFTGENILINKAADTMAVGQVQSLSLVLALVFIVMSFLFVNLKAGALSLIPNIFPIVVNFGIMGLLGVPLNTGTAMVAAIAIGIAVDDTIHLMTRYNKEMRLLQDQQKAVDACMSAEIRPVVSTSVALCLGFLFLGFSNFVPVIYFGLLSAEVMIFALIGDLFITPILLSSTQLITLWDMMGLKLQEAVAQRSKLFEGLRKWQIKKVVLLGRLLEKEAGEFVVRQGGEGKSMFLLLEGKAQVVGRDENTQKTMVFTELNPGDIFGEIALVEPGPRSADVKSLEPVKYLEIDMEGLKRIQRIYPRIGGRLFLNLSRILGQRLIRTNQLLLKKM